MCNSVSIGHRTSFCEILTLENWVNQRSRVVEIENKINKKKKEDILNLFVSKQPYFETPCM